VSRERIRPTRISVPAMIALLFGLLALAFSWVPLIGVLAFLFGLIAVIIAAMALRKIRLRGRGGLSLAITGLVTGLIGLVIVLSIFRVFLHGFHGPAWERDEDQVRRLFKTTPR
jgi:hypothetical protein